MVHWSIGPDTEAQARGTHEEGAIFHLHDGPLGRLRSVPHWLWQVVVSLEPGTPPLTQL